MNFYYILLILILIIVICYYFNYIHNNEHFKTKNINIKNLKEINPDTIYHHLCYIDDILTKNKIKHWIMYGTLLGAIRDKSIIPHDYDFDFGANIEDRDKILSLNKIVNKDGYLLQLQSLIQNEFNNIKKSKYVWRISVKVLYEGIEFGDIYLYQKFDDGYMRRFNKEDGCYFWPNSTYPSVFTDNLVSQQINDRYFDAPMDGHILLSHWYGDSWKTPYKAQAQGGDARNGSDYFGGSTSVKLENLTNYVNSNYNLNIKPNLQDKIIYFYPLDQKDWIIDNEYSE